MNSPDDSSTPPTLELLAALCDDTLTPEQGARLNALLAADPAARRQYLLYMELHGSLHWNLLSADTVTADAFLSDPGSIDQDVTPSVTSSDTMVLPALRETNAADDWRSLPTAPSTPHASGTSAGRRFIHRVAWLGAAAAVVLGASIGWRLLSNQTPVLPAPAAVASIAGSVNAEWNDPSPVFTSPTTLRSGEAKLRFGNGTEVILRGPAQFQVLSSKLLRLSSGQAVATVSPAARGFSIETPEATVVDLGTEFGVSAGSAGETEIHVFRGEVTVAKGGAAVKKSPARQSVIGGAAVKIRADAETAISIPIASARFIREKEFQAFQAAAALSPADAAYARWLSASLVLRRDPRVMAYYTFDTGGFAGVTTLPNLAGTDRSADATIENARFSAGRFSQKQSVDLQPPGGRVNVNIPGEVTKLTLVAWIDVRSIRHPLPGAGGFYSPWSSLLMSDGYSPAGGYVHWQLDHAGQLSLSVNHRPPEPNYESPPVFAAAQIGNWHQVATVYDLPGQRIAFYMDGKLIQTLAPNAESRLTIGQASIGNWTPAGEPVNGRSFDGKVDELIAFRDALTDSEIAKLYDDTRPADAPAAAGH